MRTYFALAVALLLGACDGSNDDFLLKECVPFPPGSTVQVEQGNDCCTAFGERSTIDGDGGSFGQIALSSQQPTSASFIAKAPSGFTINPGSQAGVLFASGGDRTGTSLSVQTKLGDTVQEQAVVASGDGIGQFSTFYGFPTSKPFDSVKVTFARSAQSGSASGIVFEICRDKR